MTIGFWVLPTLVTVISFWWAFSRFEKSVGWIDMAPFANTIRLGAALIISLIAWLIWAVLT